MNQATHIMKEEIKSLNFKEPENTLISNVTGKEIARFKWIKKFISSANWK